jgi:hypothetical protein
MKADPWTDPRVEKVRASEAREYMLRNGWSLRPFPQARMLVFAGPLDDTGNAIELVAPAAENASDYVQRIIELITSLAAIENRHAVAVLDEMLQQTSMPPVPLPNGSNQGARTPPSE